MAMNSFKKLIMMANQIDDKPSLPKEYVQLEWLEFTGTQWIDTRITPILSDELEFECIVKQPSTSNWAIFGSGDGSVIWAFVGSLFRGTLIGGYYRYFEGGTSRLSNNIIQSTDTLNIIECRNDGYFYVNGVQYFSKPNAFNDIELSTPLYIGTRGSKAHFFTGIIGKFKLTDKNGRLKLNLIPALRIADSKPGMYDLVSGQFFVNQGTGEFVYSAYISAQIYINTILQSVVTGEELDNMDSLLQQISQSQEDVSSINTQLENIINT